MNLIAKVAKGKYVSILAVLFIAAYSGINDFHHSFSVASIEKNSVGKAMLNVLPYYDAAQAYEHLKSYDASTLAIYKNVLLLDMLLLIPLYALFLSGALYFFSKKFHQKWLKALAWIPLAAGLLNYVEDFIGFYLIENLPVEHLSLAQFSGYVTATKTVGISITLITVIGSTVIFFGKKLYHKLFKKSVTKTLDANLN